MKIEEMADVFLNSANFASHAFLTVAPPSGYALNLKSLIKVSKVTWTYQLSYEIFRKFDKTNFSSPKSTPSKSPGLLELKNVFFLNVYNTELTQLFLEFLLKRWDKSRKLPLRQHWGILARTLRNRGVINYIPWWIGEWKNVRNLGEQGTRNSSCHP